MVTLALVVDSLVALATWSGRISSGNIICLRQTRFSAEAHRLLDTP